MGKYKRIFVMMVKNESVVDVKGEERVKGLVMTTGSQHNTKRSFQGDTTAPSKAPRLAETPAETSSSERYPSKSMSKPLAPQKMNITPPKYNITQMRRLLDDIALTHTNQHSRSHWWRHFDNMRRKVHGLCDLRDQQAKEQDIALAKHLLTHHFKDWYR